METALVCVSACTTHAELNNIYVVTFSHNILYDFIPSTYQHLMATEFIFGYKDEIKTQHHQVFLMLHRDCRAENWMFCLPLLR